MRHLPLKRINKNIIVVINEKIESAARYEYRNRTKSWNWKCTICNHKWRRFSPVYLIEHLQKHINDGIVKESDVYVEVGE